MLSQSKIRHSFQRALVSYNDSALVQKNSARTLVEHLINTGMKPSLARTFEFGCGTGFLTKHLNERFKIKELIVNDLLEECQKYLPLSDISFIAGDVEDITVPTNCELICSASCVQWSADLPSLLKRLASSLTDRGYLAISSFGDGHFKELEKLKTQQSFNTKEQLNFWSEQAWRQHLKSAYQVESIIIEETTLWFDSVRELLLHLRQTGVNGNARHTWNKQSLAMFETDYRDNFERDGKVPLSYQPIYIVARKNNI